MSIKHAVVLIDHQHAQVMRFDSGPVQSHKIEAHHHNTRQHGSNVRTEHEFFGEVCDALQGFNEILVAGAHKAQADFRHYVEKHRAHLAPKIVGWETVDHPSEGQLAALARKFFVAHDRMAGIP